MDKTDNFSHVTDIVQRIFRAESGPNNERKVVSMKKTLALMLVLCMMLASIPVLAETDFTGTWYLVLTGITCGTFELNADGTCVGATAASREGEKLNGTWSAEGNAVTLTIREEPLKLVFDGTDLLIGAEETDAQKDGTVPGDILKFSRKAGEVATDELNAYISAGTVPEGKTKEDMEKAMDQMALLFLTAVESAVEASYAGTWYLVMAGMTCGTFELNADGTCAGTAAASGEKKLDGSWAAEGDTVTLTIAGQTLLLVSDGTDLAIYAEADTPELASVLKFSREPGVTIDELNAFTSAGTIPEGKTKEDMEKIQAQMGMLYIVAELIH